MVSGVPYPLPENQADAELEKARDTQVLGCRGATWPVPLPSGGGGLERVVPESYRIRAVTLPGAGNSR